MVVQGGPVWSVYLYPEGITRRALPTIATLASSIWILGAITSPRPASRRWGITTARQDCRGISSRGSRPFGAKPNSRTPMGNLAGLAYWAGCNLLTRLAAWFAGSPGPRRSGPLMVTVAPAPVPSGEGSITTPSKTCRIRHGPGPSSLDSSLEREGFEPSVPRLGWGSVQPAARYTIGAAIAKPETPTVRVDELGWAFLDVRRAFPMDKSRASISRSVSATSEHRRRLLTLSASFISETQPDQPWARETSAPPVVRPCPRGSPAPPGPPRARSGHCR